MLIVINEGWTYETDIPVKLGDLVLLPPAPHMEGPWTSTVIAVDSDYEGYLKSVIRIVSSKKAG